MKTIKTSQTIFVLLVLLAIVAFLSSCSGLSQKSRKTDFYTLEYEAKKITDKPPLSAVIRIGRFQTAPFYNSNRIVYRDKDFKRDTYSYHKWLDNPGDLVTYFLARDMEVAGLFKAVFAPGSRSQADYSITGTVDEFFEYDSANKWEAKLTVGITLMRENEHDASKRIVFQKRYTEKEPCTKKNPLALARAMSKAMDRLSNRITADVYQNLEKER